ncbi:MAG: hypothetical protein ACYCWW_17440 [Deltaproteobacteria bacterium]
MAIQIHGAILESMAGPWKVLEEAGVPIGALRPAKPRSGRSLREALREALSAPAPESSLEALWAWLRAFRQHWPARFSACLGEDGLAALRELSARPFDENRYLKLRRIALANLAAATPRDA